MNHDVWYRKVVNFYNSEKQIFRRELGLPPKAFKAHVELAKERFSDFIQANNDDWDRVADDYILTGVWVQLQGNALALFAQECEELVTSSQKQILEGGCGIGLDLAFLAQSFPTINFVGADTAARMLNVAFKRRDRLNIKNLNFIACGYSELQDTFGSKYFDAIYINAPSLDWHDDAFLIKISHNLFEVLKEDGQLVIVNNNVPSPFLIKAGFQTKYIIKLGSQSPSVFYCQFSKTNKKITARHGVLPIGDSISLLRARNPLKYEPLWQTHPELKSEWDIEKNNKEGWRWNDPKITASSDKRAWWICKTCGHSWRTMIFHRARSGHGCPLCAGFNYKLLADQFPELKIEWETEKNSKLGLSWNEVYTGSSQKAWWKCQQCGHSWQATIVSRTTAKTGCPRCAGFLTEPLSLTNQELRIEWDRLRNKEELNLHWEDPDLTAGSQKKVWWTCQICGHSWKTTIFSRARKQKGCPSCAGHISQSLSESRPDLENEWDEDKNAELGLEWSDPKLRPGSGKKVWWRCKTCDYSWKTRIEVRARQNAGCPSCGGFLLKTLSESNPELEIEWDYEKNLKDFGLRWEDSKLSPGSGKKVWWKCKVCKNSWKATIASRTRLGAGCRECYYNSRRKKKSEGPKDIIRKGSSRKSPRRSTRGGQSFDIGPQSP